MFRYPQNRIDSFDSMFFQPKVGVVFDQKELIPFVEHAESRVMNPAFIALKFLYNP